MLVFNGCCQQRRPHDGSRFMGSITLEGDHRYVELRFAKFNCMLHFYEFMSHQICRVTFLFHLWDLRVLISSVSKGLSSSLYRAWQIDEEQLYVLEVEKVVVVFQYTMILVLNISHVANVRHPLRKYRSFVANIVFKICGRRLYINTGNASKVS